VLALLATADTADSAPVPSACDFDGDGFDELVIPTPLEDLAGAPDAGGVAILYGSPDGPARKGDLFLSQATPGVPGATEPGDMFGQSIACGDFDSDGFGDLAVSAPGETNGSKPDAGMVVVVPGSADGLDPASSRHFTQGSVGAPGGNGVGDRFGWSLTACDFNGDGHGDLAIGAPGESVGGDHDAGSIHVLYGAGAGLRASGAAHLTQDTPRIAGAAESSDAFGYALACGDVVGSGKDDLVVGTPFDRYAGVHSTGTVTVLVGRKAGVRASGSARIAQGAGTTNGDPETGDGFGLSLAVADFDGDGRADIAVSAPREAIGLTHDAGSAAVIYGSADLTQPDGWYLHRDKGGIRGGAAPNALFGWSLSAGDFNGDGLADLAVAAPGSTVSGKPEAGDLTVLFGSPGGLTAAGDRLLSQDRAGIAGTAQSGDRFGWGLETSDVDGGRDDLIVFVPGEDLSGVGDGGAAFVVYGRAKRFGRDSSASIHQDRPGVAQSAEPGDRAGQSPGECPSGLAGCGHPVCPTGPGSPTGAIPMVDSTTGVSGPGALRTFSIQVESGLRINRDCFAEAVTEILFDERSWGARGEVAFRRVDHPGADLQVILASPAKTDELCYPLNTEGTLSCRVGRRIVLNALRWEVGVSAFGADLRGYQGYLVNHEIGHGLGQGHRSCPGAGSPAPVMMQQSKGVGSCLPNPWPLGYELSSLSLNVSPGSGVTGTAVD